MSSGSFNPITPPPDTKADANADAIAAAGTQATSPAQNGSASPAPSVPRITAIQTTGPSSQNAASPTSVLPIAAQPVRQLSDRPVTELFAVAEEIGLRPRRYKTVQQLIAAIHARRQLIATLNRDAMVDVLRWSSRPAPTGASKEGLAHLIVGIKTMRFDNLSQRGLVVLAALRGLEVTGEEHVPKLIRKLKRQESFFGKINRKRRSLLGSIVSNMIGGSATAPTRDNDANGTDDVSAASASIKHDIEEAGLLGGLAGRIKKSADGYVNQKLDEIEARIDRKLDEIDRRLAEWRDKEVANRIRILKITLWASVIVGVFSMMYSYVRVYLR